MDQREIGGMIAVTIGAIILAVIFQVAPLLGSEVEQACIVESPHATGTLSYTGIVADAETVTIGSEVYEYDTNLTASEITGGNIEVDIADTSIATATTNLTNVINSESSLVSAAIGDNSVIVTALVAGSAGNDIEVNETIANATWGVKAFQREVGIVHPF